MVENLKTHFALESGTVHAVDGVSFRLDHGEALGIAGESGCGKTTTALSLVRLLPPNAKIVDGSIKLYGIDLVQKSDNALRRYRWREIAIVFQGAMNALNPVHRVRDQIAEPLVERLGVSEKAARRRAGELLELVGIPKKRGGAYPHELSGGMRQRAMIAMALACDPAIVIGDEPTTALDVMVQAQILELLEHLRHELGLSLILITHDLSVIAETCDRVLIMYAGRVAEEGSVAEVFRRPRHPYTQKLLYAFPNIHADRRTLEVIPGSPPDLRHPPPGCRFAPRCEFAMAGLHRGRAAGGDVRRRPGRLPPLPGGQRRGPGHDADGRRDRRDGAARRAARPTSCRSSRSVRASELSDRPDARGAPDPERAGAAPAAGADRRAEGWRSISRSGAGRRRAPAPPARRRPGGRRDRPHLRRGEVLALVGESGSGKTTTGRVIVKLTRQTAGRSGSTARTSRDAVGHRGAAGLPAPGPADLPGPVRDAEPEAVDLRLRRRAARRQRHRDARPSARPRSSRRSKPPACARPPTSPRATRTSCRAASASAS